MAGAWPVTKGKPRVPGEEGAGATSHKPCRHHEELGCVPRAFVPLICLSSVWKIECRRTKEENCEA